MRPEDKEEKGESEQEDDRGDIYFSVSCRRFFLAYTSEWPAALRASVELCYSTARAVMVWCGNELLQIGNQAARARFPWHVAFCDELTAPNAWSSIWSQLAPLVDDLRSRKHTSVNAWIDHSGKSSEWSLCAVYDDQDDLCGIIVYLGEVERPEDPKHLGASAASSLMTAILERRSLGRPELSASSKSWVETERCDELMKTSKRELVCQIVRLTLEREIATDLLDKMLETEAVGIIVFDQLGKVVATNEVFLRMVAYEKSEVQSERMTWRNFTPDDWIDESARQLEICRVTGRIGPYKKQYVTKTGEKKWMLFVGRSIDENLIIEYCIDIQQQIEAQIALQEGEGRIAALAAAIPQIVWATDSSGRIKALNAEWRKYSGAVSDPATLDQLIELYVHPEEKTRTRRALAFAKQHKSMFEVEHRVRAASGSFRWFLTRANPVSLDGASHTWVGIMTDIHNRVLSEQRALVRRDRTEHLLSEKIETLQAELLRASRVSAAGEIAAALAHQLNQPLTGIASYLGAIKVLIKASDPAEVTAGYITAAIDQVISAGEIIQRLRDFVGGADSEKSFVSVETLVKDALMLAFAGTSDLGIQTGICIQDGLPCVLADRVQVEQVLVNLLRNAIEAVAENDPRERRIEVRAERASGRTVKLEISDSGRGPAAEVADRIFEPFLSTKRNGMGVGLSISRSIILNHQGQIWWERRDRQTTFTLTLPHADAAVAHE